MKLFQDKHFLINVIFKTKTERVECFSRSVLPTGWCLDQHRYLRFARKANVTYSEESIIACQRNFARLRSQKIRETIKVRINMQICLLVSRETQAQGRDRNPRRIKSEGLLAQRQVLGFLSASYVGGDLAYLNIEISQLKGAKNPEPSFGQVSREEVMCQYYTK